jgi:hypothetical protein
MVKYLIIGAIGLYVVAVVGCGAKLDLSEVTTKAITATMEVQSYHMSAVDTYTVDGETGESTYESEFVAPDRYHERLSSECNGSECNWLEVISIGNQSYIRGSDIPQWCQSPCQYDDPSSGGIVMAEGTPIRLEEQLGPLNWLVDLKQLPEEMIDGADCWHYRGKFDMDSYVDMLQERAKEGEDGQIPEQVFDQMRRATRNCEFWAEKESYLIRQLKSEEHLMVVDPDTGEEKPSTRSTIIQLYDFNEPISIELPQLEAK